MKAKKLQSNQMWAYFAPNGYIQVRSMGFTKEEARNAMDMYGYLDNPPSTWQEYEAAGFECKKINVKIVPLEK